MVFSEDVQLVDATETLSSAAVIGPDAARVVDAEGGDDPAAPPRAEHVPHDQHRVLSRGHGQHRSREREGGGL
jgi:hypothetical protein